MKNEEEVSSKFSICILTARARASVLKKQGVKDRDKYLELLLDTEPMLKNDAVYLIIKFKSKAKLIEF